MAVQRLPRKSNSATRIGVGALIALTLSTGVATVVNLQAGEASTGPTASATATSDPSSATEYVLSQSAERRELSDSVARETKLSEVLPNHLFAVGDRTPAPLGAGLVFGTITAAVPGSAYLEGDSGPEEVAFDSSEADWRVLVLSVEVESAVGAVSGSSTVSIGMVLDPLADIDLTIKGYESMGEIIAVLNGPGRYDFDKTLYSVRQEGALIGLVSDSGEISFPAVREEADFIGDLHTVADVLAEATAPVTITKIQRAAG